MSKIIFPTFNISMGQAVGIVKYSLDDESISIKTKVLAIEQVSEMETHNSVTKEDLVCALRWMFQYFDFDV